MEYIIENNQIFAEDMSSDCGCTGESPVVNSYMPFYTSSDPLNDVFLSQLEGISSSKYMEDGKGDNLLVASDEGSKIFSKQGMNYMVGSQAKDSFFFSMCSTKPQDGKTSVVHGFEDGKDKVYLFCTKREISPDEVTVVYNPEFDNTVLYINDPIGEVAISFLGMHDGLLGDVILNSRWADNIE